VHRDDSSRNVTEEGLAAATTVDAVEADLVKALVEASSAARFDIVAVLAREIEERRLAHSGNVVALDPKIRSRRP
jgi:hypothetical protein